MGSGKSSVGVLLAAATGRAFYDLDKLIEEKSEKSVAQLFSDKGESAFRISEQEVLAATLKINNCVIATGGGVILSFRNRELLAAGSRVLLLEASLAELERRLSLSSENRPLLIDNVSGAKRLAQLLDERQQLYRKTADIVIHTDGLEPQQVVARIIGELEQMNV